MTDEELKELVAENSRAIREGQREFREEMRAAREESDRRWQASRDELQQESDRRWQASRDEFREEMRAAREESDRRWQAFQDELVASRRELDRFMTSIDKRVESIDRKVGRIENKFGDYTEALCRQPRDQRGLRRRDQDPPAPGRHRPAPRPPAGLSAVFPGPPGQEALRHPRRTGGAARPPEEGHQGGSVPDAGQRRDPGDAGA